MTSSSTAHKTRGRPPKKVTEASVKPSESKFEPILIHFVSDGFTALGAVWVAEQELEITEEVYPEVESWINLSDEEQIDRWGEVKFKKGPSLFPNPIINYRKDYRETVKRGCCNTYSSSLSSKCLESLAEKERQRGRGLPQ